MVPYWLFSTVQYWRLIKIKFIAVAEQLYAQAAVFKCERNVKEWNGLSNTR